MPTLAAFSDETFTLDSLSQDEYIRIDEKDPRERALVAKAIVEGLDDDPTTHKNFRTLMVSLSKHWFNTKGTHFSVDGVPEESFVTDLITAYVYEYDADSLLEAVLHDDMSNFQLSQNSSKLYNALQSAADKAFSGSEELLAVKQLLSVHAVLIAQTIAKRKLMSHILEQMFFGGAPFGAPEPEFPIYDNDEQPQENPVSTVVLWEPIKKGPTLEQASEKLRIFLKQSEFADTETGDKIIDLIDYVSKLNKQKAVPEAELVKVIQSTQALLAKNINVESYLTQTKNFHGAGSDAWKNLGKLMMGIGALLIVSAIAAAIVGSLPVASSLVIGGGLSMGLGYAFFDHGRPSGVAKSAIEVAESYDTAIQCN